MLRALICGALLGLGGFAYSIKAIDLSLLTSAQATSESTYGPGSVHRHWQPTGSSVRIPHEGRTAALFEIPSKGDRADLIAVTSFGSSDFLVRNDRAERNRRQIAKELASMAPIFEEVTGIKPDFTAELEQASQEDLLRQVTGVQPIVASDLIDNTQIPLPKRHPLR